MPFPQVAATNNSAEASTTTSHTVALPADISSGDLLLVFFACDSPTADPIVGFPVGWTQFFDQGDAADASWLAVAWRKADGEEGASITVTTTASEQSAHISYRITGHEDPTTQPPEASAPNTGSSTTPNPLSLTPTGGSKDYLWLAVQDNDNAYLTSSYPTNYTNGEEKISAEGFGTCHVSLARRELAAASEDPSTFTLATSETWVAITIAIHPTVDGNVLVTPAVIAQTLTEYASILKEVTTPTTLSLVDTQFIPILKFGITPSTLALITARHIPVIIIPARHRNVADDFWDWDYEPPVRVTITPLPDEIQFEEKE